MSIHLGIPRCPTSAAGTLQSYIFWLLLCWPPSGPLTKDEPLLIPSFQFPCLCSWACPIALSQMQDFLKFHCLATALLACTRNGEQKTLKRQNKQIEQEPSRPAISRTTSPILTIRVLLQENFQNRLFFIIPFTPGTSADNQMAKGPCKTS